MKGPGGGAVSDLTYRPPEGFLTMAQATEQLGITIVTLRKLVRRTGVQVYQDPTDARVKLLKAEDVKRLRQPVPMPPEGKAKAA
jgi:hypothetical protein